MADLCNACSERFLGKHGKIFNDLAGRTSHISWENGKAAVVTCEGCGVIQVDPYGNCVSPDCLRAGEPGHGLPWIVSAQANVSNPETKPSSHIQKVLLNETLSRADDIAPTAAYSFNTRDDYLYKYLAYHLHSANRGLSLTSLLLNVNWIQKKLSVTDVYTLLQDFNYADDDKDVSKVKKALELSQHILIAHPDQWPSQLFGRLIDFNSLALDGLKNDILSTHSKIWLRPITKSLIPAGLTLVRTLDGHTSFVERMILRPNSHQALSTSRDHTVQLWDLETGARIRQLGEHRTRVTSIAVTKNGKLVISLSEDRTLKVWDIDEGQECFSCIDHSCFSLVSDGSRVISGLVNGSIILWDSNTGTEFKRFDSHGSSVAALAVTPDCGHAVSVATDGTSIVWDLSAGKKQFELQGNENSAVTDLTITLDGRFVIGYQYNGPLQVWDLSTGKKRFSVADYKCFQVVPDTMEIVFGSQDGNLSVWNLESATERIRFKSHNGPIEKVLVMANGSRVVSSGEDGVVSICDRYTGARCLSLHEPGQHLKLQAIVLDDKSVLCTTVSERLETNRNDDVNFSVWDGISGVKSGSFNAYGYVETLFESSFPFIAGDFLITGNFHGALRVWDLRASNILEASRQHSSRVIQVAITPDGRTAFSASVDGTLNIWEFQTGEKRLEIRHIWNDDLNGILKVLDNERILCYSGNSAKVYDLTTGSMVISFVGDKSDTKVIKVSQSAGRLAVGHKMWDINTGRLLSSMAHYELLFSLEGSIGDVTMAQDGNKVIVGFESGAIAVWDIRQSDHPFMWDLYASGVSALIFTPDQNYVISGHQDGTLIMWTFHVTERGTEKFRLKDHKTAISEIAVAPDGRSLISRDRDNMYKVWNFITGDLEWSSKGEEGDIGQVRIWMNEKIVVPMSVGNTFMLWSLMQDRSIVDFTIDEEVASYAVNSSGTEIILGDVSGCVHLLCVDDLKPGDSD